MTQNCKHSSQLQWPGCFNGCMACELEVEKKKNKQQAELILELQRESKEIKDAFVVIKRLLNIPYVYGYIDPNAEHMGK